MIADAKTVASYPKFLAFIKMCLFGFYLTVDNNFPI